MTIDLNNLKTVEDKILLENEGKSLDDIDMLNKAYNLSIVINKEKIKLGEIKPPYNLNKVSIKDLEKLSGNDLIMAGIQRKVFAEFYTNKDLMINAGNNIFQFFMDNPKFAKKYITLKSSPTTLKDNSQEILLKINKKDIKIAELTHETEQKLDHLVKSDKFESLKSAVILVLGVHIKNSKPEALGETMMLILRDGLTNEEMQNQLLKYNFNAVQINNLEAVFLENKFREITVLEEVS